MMASMDVPELASFLADHPPFDGLAREAVERLAAAAEQLAYEPGDLILDAFRDPSVEVFVLLSGRVDLWNDADGLTSEPDESLSPGGLFGFSAMLTERSVGPRAVAGTAVSVARIPGDAASAAFASKRGARFLAESMFAVTAARPLTPAYGSVDELIAGEPLVVAPGDPVLEVARRMTESGCGYAVVRRGEGDYGLVTDETIRVRVVAGALPGSTPASRLCADVTPLAMLGDSAAEALIAMLEAQADHVLVVDREQRLRGVVTTTEFTLSPTTADVSLHAQLRHAETVDDLLERARRIPFLLGDLLSRGLASGKVIAVHSTIVDAVVRRAVELTFRAHPALSLDAFTWLSLGSNGRREAVLSSDIDSAVAFAGTPSEAEVSAYLSAFGEVHATLSRAGLSSDDHGATASRRAFARTNAQWRAAATSWLASPVDDQGAIMTSLLVDGRPIYGDHGLPAVTEVFTELRDHPATMRLLLQDSLARRARLRSYRDLRDLLARRPGLFDVKSYALLPIVNIARWAALSVGSSVLPTVERLEVAAGSTMLPDEQARILVEIFEVLQRLRLRYQLMQHQSGVRPSDELMVEGMSPIDRSVVAQAVREIAAVQKRMTNVASFLPTEEWNRPVPS